ncbi:MAG TPA: RNA methyltransferase [Tepidisphaeraceae bacterium]|nr:RNA methyltransferase [Tepidisphaeraceae bacterium]
MAIVHLESLDDPRVAVYRNLKDRDLLGRHGRFIAEGEFVVRRLLQSRFTTESVLLADRCLADFAPAVPEDVTAYVAPQPVVNQIVGYRFHTGILACGVRPPPLRIGDVAADDRDVLLVICPDLNNSENLGGMIRIAAGFGATAVVIGERSCDPFFRQTIRVSMGTIFSMPIVESDNILADLQWLKTKHVERIATVLSPQAQPLASVERLSRRVALLFGSEAQGLSGDVLAEADRAVTIPMQLGTDSLNVAISAGIILHHAVYMALRE